MARKVYIPKEEVRKYLAANGYNFAGAAKVFKVSRAYISQMFKDEFPAGSRSIDLATVAGQSFMLLKDAVLTNMEIVKYLGLGKTSRIGDRRELLFGYRDLCKICRKPEKRPHQRCKQVSGRRAVRIYQLKKSLARSKIHR
jgi:hypothetical protein